MNDAWFESPTLTGRFVRLEPLGEEHAEGLFANTRDPELWTWLSAPQPTDVAAMRAIVAQALEARERHQRVPFAQIDTATGEVAGTTSYYEIDAVHRGLCIGYTWLGAKWHRTGVNTEAKLLLLSHAFDDLGALRVGWHTDSRNERSRRAIERLGASFEGIHRQHRIRPDGTLRDTATYSMIDTEWPAARAALQAKLDR